MTGVEGLISGEGATACSAGATAVVLLRNEAAKASAAAERRSCSTNWAVSFSSLLSFRMDEPLVIVDVGTSAPLGSGRRCACDLSADFTESEASDQPTASIGLQLTVAVAAEGMAFGGREAPVESGSLSRAAVAYFTLRASICGQDDPLPLWPAGQSRRPSFGPSREGEHAAGPPHSMSECPSP